MGAGEKDRKVRDNKSSPFSAICICIVALPPLYVLSSGPMQLVKMGEQGAFAAKMVKMIPFGKTEDEVPDEYCEVLSRWKRPFNKLFYPLERIAFEYEIAFYLESYWNLFAERPFTPIPDVMEFYRTHGAVL